MKKKYIVIILILIIIIVASCIYVNIFFSYISIKNDTYYTCAISESWGHPNVEPLGEIKNSFDARIKAYIIWKEIYGARLFDQYPYIVEYDKKLDIWCIRGFVFPLQLNRRYVMIKGSTGEVLAVWYSK